LSTTGAVSHPLKKRIERRAPAIPPTKAASVIGNTSSFGHRLRLASRIKTTVPAINPKSTDLKKSPPNPNIFKITSSYFLNRFLLS
jgi:hypothetical protein